MNTDHVMDNIRNAFKRSGMTLNELGEGLGYDGPSVQSGYDHLGLSESGTQ